jgi:hypothetical protein
MAVYRMGPAKEAQDALKSLIAAEKDGTLKTTLEGYLSSLQRGGRGSPST